MKRLLLLAGLLLGAMAPAHAQPAGGCGVNITPQIGINCANVRASTYVGQINDLVPAAAATDIWCLNASASKNISIRQVILSGTATALSTTPVSFIRRNTLDTGGTSSTPAITLNNTLNAAATATAIQYTANPTINDSTSHQSIRFSILTLTPTTAVAGDISPGVTWSFGTAVDAYNQGADLVKGTTQQFCINWGAATTAGNALYGTVEWTEN